MVLTEPDVKQALVWLPSPHSDNNNTTSTDY